MIDLHIHTTHSDGTDSVEEVLRKVEEIGLEVISITDHDSIDGYLELDENPELRNIYSGEIIIGSELKTIYKNIPIEVLAYGMDYKKIDIFKYDKLKMQEDVLYKLKLVAKGLGFVFNEENLYVDVNDCTRQFGSFVLLNEILSHDENSKLIDKYGNFNPVGFYRNHQCNMNSPFYVDESKYTIPLEEVIDRIHNAGGLAFLAHGFIYPFENKENEIEEILKNYNLDGLECEYIEFSNDEREIAKKLCLKYNKYMSGGSDYHAKNKPTINLGTGRNNNLNIKKELILPWFDKVRKY